MPLQPQQFARRDGGSTQLRADALRLAWILEDLSSSDSHVLRVRFSCSAQIANTDADKRMFCEQFLGSSPVAGVAEIVSHFAVPLRTAAAQIAPRFRAEDWLTGQSAEMQSALVTACKPIAFACGLEVLPPFQVEVASPSLERSRIESMHRAQAEQRVAGQVLHLQKATELLKQFHLLREQMPQLTPGEVLEHMNPIDRGSTLQSLLMASAKQSHDLRLWAVAGPFLVMIDLVDSQPKTELISLPTTMGPLRSVQPCTIRGRRLLLVGARSGVMVVPTDSPAETQTYLDPTVQTQLGFNRAVVRSEEIWASHGEAGVVGWKIGQITEPFARFSANPNAATDRPADLPSPSPISVGGSPSLVTTGARSTRASGPRNLQPLDADHLVYSVASELMILGDGEARVLGSESKSEIVAILPDERTMLIVHADSTVAVLSRDSRQIIDRQRRAGRVTAAAALPWLGSVRMLLVDSYGPIDCVGFDDPLITQYSSNHTGLRAVAAGPSLVAALSSDRQRIILWASWDGRSPIAEVHVTGAARHRVADVDFG